MYGESERGINLFMSQLIYWSKMLIYSFNLYYDFIFMVMDTKLPHILFPFLLHILRLSSLHFSTYWSFCLYPPTAYLSFPAYFVLSCLLSPPPLAPHKFYPLPAWHPPSSLPALPFSCFLPSIFLLPWLLCTELLFAHLSACVSVCVRACPASRYSWIGY